MFKKRMCLFLILGITIINIQAQKVSSDYTPEIKDIFSLIQDESFGGIINLYQDPSLHVLIDKNTRLNEKNGITGYRIQIYSGSGVAARDNANNIKKEFMEIYPTFDETLIYVAYLAPYFKVSIGDYRNKNEAFELYHSIKKEFPGTYIVKSRINFPKLELSAEN